jgi:putative endonuclease
MIYQRLAKVFLICSDDAGRHGETSSWRKPGPIITAGRLLQNLSQPMNAERSYYVYILASRHHGTLYIGVTNDIRTRLEQHRSGRGSKFVQQHKVFRLVHVETFATPQEAIAREKQLKFWKRDWKIKLIETDNPDWNDRTGLI